MQYKIPDSLIELFVILYIVLVLLFFLIYPLFLKNKNHSQPVAGLGLPRGSVRAMIAIAIIGSYLVTLTIGSFLITAEKFQMILTAFGSLSGAVVGFYFGSGGSGGSGGGK